MEFTVKTTIPAKAENIYKAWLDRERHSLMTGGVAEVSDEPGGHFTAWDGYIQGKNVVLEPYKRIVQSWRTSEFKPEEPDSEIELILEEKESGTELTLIHRNLSENGGHYKKGWEDHYFQPMQDYFSKKSDT